MLEPVIEPVKRSVYSCCIFTACPCCAHTDQAVGLCSHIVFHHFSPWAPLLSPPQPNTVQRGLGGCFCPERHTHENGKNAASPALCEPTVSPFWRSWWLFIPQEHNVENQIILQMYFITLSFLFHRSLPRLTRTLKKNTSAHERFCCETAVRYTLIVTVHI